MLTYSKCRTAIPLHVNILKAASKRRPVSELWALIALKQNKTLVKKPVSLVRSMYFAKLLPCTCIPPTDTVVSYAMLSARTASIMASRCFEKALHGIIKHMTNVQFWLSLNNKREIIVLDYGPMLGRSNRGNIEGGNGSKTSKSSPFACLHFRQSLLHVFQT